MSTVWRPAPRNRPDPYLDWERRTRKTRDETWCSVQVEVISVDGDYLQSLRQLRDAVNNGRQPDDDAPSKFTTIAMAIEEKALLERRIGEGGSIKDEVEAQFFIYRWEPFIYDNGKFRNSSFYRIKFAGPPIKGLQFNRPNQPADPLTFPNLIVTRPSVAIGIVDDGIAFAHERFRISGKSRIAALWLQETERRGGPDNGVLFGQRLHGDTIDKLLEACSSESEIYRQVGVTDFGRNEYNPLAARVAHGTHVLDLATGGERDRPIFAVQLPSAATIDTSGVTMGSYVLQAVRMIMSWADQLGINQRRKVPLVINFSYGLLAGPKDGTHFLEVALADLIRYRTKHVAPTYLVLPAGNSYRSRAAARMVLKAGHADSLDLVILPDDGTANFIEIWLDGAAGTPRRCPVRLAMTPPGSKPVEIQPEKGAISELVGTEGPIAGIYYDVVQHGTLARERILLAINPTVRNDDGRDLAPSGRWKLSIANLTKRKVTAHIYVQRDDTPFGYPRRGRQSHLDHARAYERDPKTGDYGMHAKEGCPIIYEDTLSSIATCSPADPDCTLVVGAAEATDHYPPADYTSSGPTRARQGPDCAAFGDEGDAHWGILAAGTFSGSTVAMRGTSVAAPQVVRQLADQLASSSPASPRGVKVADADKHRLGEVIVPLPLINPVRRRYPV